MNPPAHSRHNRGMSHRPPSTAALRPHFAPAVIAWQRTHGRHDLPWQRCREPYHVWLSEIMLQQTQVSTVLAYYERFLQRFPDVRALAQAGSDEVMAAWSGLGYYSRARNLHRCAQVVVHEHAGQFPRTAQALAELPGIGRSTAAAIAAFCFGERAAILDGNVKRVLTRVLGFGEDLAQARHERALWDEATALLPGQDMAAYTQGLMDLGATVCTARSPRCLHCPVQAWCAARAEGRPEAYPVRTRKLRRSRREHWWLWLEHEGRVWLQPRPAHGVWAGLHSLPEYDSEAALQADWPGPLIPWPSISHALTHFDWLLHPRQCVLHGPEPQPPGPGQWVAYEALADWGLPAPLRKLLASRGSV